MSAADAAKLQARFDKAVALHQAGKLQQAESIYRTVLRSMPHNEQVLSNLGAIYIALGKVEKAEMMLRRALKHKPDFPMALTNLGMVLSERAKYDEAEDVYRRLIAQQPSAADAHFNLATLLYDRRRFDDALAHFEKATSLNPRFANSRFNLGNCYRELGRISEAVDAYKMALELQPGHSGAQINLATVMRDQGNFDEALRRYRYVLKNEPHNYIARVNLGETLLDLEQAAAALLEFERAIEVESQMASAYIHAGNALLRLERRREAVQRYETALRLEPGHVVAERNLQRALAQQIPRWHFGMLADEQRNEAYRRAIEKAVGADSLVLDIGTGSGLLAMMAARAGASRVVACESSALLADAARQIVADNGLDAVIEIVNKKSNALTVGEYLPAPATVVVSEIFDAGLLGEGVLPTMRHATQHLAAPDAMVIPAAATVHVLPVEVPALRAAYPLRTVAGFDLSAFNRFQIAGEYLRSDLAREEYRALTAVQSTPPFDFGSPPPTALYSDPHRVSWNVPVERDGAIQAIAFWFDLHLDDEITVSSGPDGALRHWGQALFFLSDDRPVAEGETISFALLHSDEQIWFEVAPRGEE